MTETAATKTTTTLALLYFTTYLRKLLYQCGRKKGGRSLRQVPTNCCIALRGGGWLVPFCCCWLGDRAVTNVGFFVWLVWLLHDDRLFGNNNNKTSSVFSFDLISSWFLGVFCLLLVVGFKSCFCQRRSPHTQSHTEQLAI